MKSGNSLGATAGAMAPTARNDRPDVSVVVTCFNYGIYLAGCLESVLAQTYTDIDVVVIDDGSTDNTREVAHRFLRDRRVRYHFQPNRGQAAAKNAGVLLTGGELVAFIDADDEWHPSKLELQVPLFENLDVGVVYSAMDTLDECGHVVPSADPSGFWAYRRGVATKWLAFDNFVPFSSVVVRRSLMDRYGGFDEDLKMGIDWDLWLRLAPATEFDYVPRRLLRYRRGHQNQMSKNWDGRIAAADRIFGRFIADHPDALTLDELRRVRLYNACSRAAGYRPLNRRKAFSWIMKALRLSPLSPGPYLELARQLRRTVLGG